MTYSLYYISRRIAVIEAHDDKSAWRKAHHEVRRCARSRGEIMDCSEPPVIIFATANRSPCVSCGDYRAVPTRATTTKAQP
jgi:hypothetical protein